jgi:ribonuclease HI
MILTEFDISFVSQKSIKGQALADFLALHPIPDDSPLLCEFPDENICCTTSGEPTWEMYFDGASSVKPVPGGQIPQIKAGAGLIFITPEGGITRHALTLTAPCTNNEAEYEALIAGLEIARELKISRLMVFGDSQLIMRQVTGEYQVRKPELMKYCNRAREIMKFLPSVTFARVSRALNGKADALARVAKELSEGGEGDITITIENRKPLASKKEEEETMCPDSLEALTVDVNEDWREPFIAYLIRGNEALPTEKSAREQIRKRALRFAYVNNTLYRRSADTMWLKCVSSQEAKHLIKEVHEGMCGAHEAGPKMCHRIKRLGYYWPTMIADCIKGRKYVTCVKSIALTYINHRTCFTQRLHHGHLMPGEPIS